MSVVMGMLDIETLGTEPAGAAITTVGLVSFTKQEILDRGYWRIDPRWSPGRRDRSTWEWWQKQNAAVREESMLGQMLPWEVTEAISAFVATSGMELIWAYPTRFDLGHLREMYHSVGHAFPMEFWRERDMTTLMRVAYGIDPTLEPAVKVMRSKNIAAHNALADAVNQAEVVQFLLRELNVELASPDRR